MNANLKRKKIPAPVVVSVLTQSRRRCCICSGIDGDRRPKDGQIAHLDGNRSNNSEVNLAWLCLKHHDKFDTKPSVSRGLDVNEVKRHREDLYNVMKENPRRSDFGKTKPACVRKSPRNVLRDKTLAKHQTDSPCQIDAAVRSLCEVSKQSDLVLGRKLNGARVIEGAEKWDAVNEVMKMYHKDDTTTMQLMSLIRPGTWKDEKNWFQYHQCIRQIALHSTLGLSRRLHVVDVHEINDSVKLQFLLNLVLSEYLCNIRSRVLMLDNESIRALQSNGNNFGHCASLGFSPFDCATITAQSGEYTVIFSDISPYFVKEGDSDFRLKLFSGSDNTLYYALRANFYRAWHQNNRDNLLCISLLYRKAKQIGIDQPFNDDMIREFLGGKGATSAVPSVVNLDRLLSKVPTSSFQHTIPETERCVENGIKELLSRGRKPA